MATDRKQLQSLIDLITYDQKIFDMKMASQQEEDSITSIQTKIDTLQEELTQEQEKLKEASRSVKQFESTMKELDQKEKDKTKQLDTVANDSEYKAIKKEIDYFKQQQHDLEKLLVESWNKYEQSEKKFEEFRVNTEKETQTLTDELNKHKQTLSDIESNTSELSNQRRPQEEGIPEEWLEKYNMIKSQNSNPLSVVVQNTCSSCFYPLTAQDLLDIGNKKLIQCRECYRFLYREEEKADD